jgi:hypothetical protein
VTETAANDDDESREAWLMATALECQCCAWCTALPCDACCAGGVCDVTCFCPDAAWVWRVEDDSTDTRLNGRAPTQSIAEKEATAAARALLQADIDALGAA